MHCRRLRKPSSPVFVETKESCPYLYKSSPIEGLGVFAKKKLPKSYNLGNFLISKNGDNFPKLFHRDELCRFMNHSNNHNVAIKLNNEGNLQAFTIRDILPDEEILANYKDITEMLHREFLPFSIGKPVIIRTKKLIDHGRASGNLFEDLRKIVNGEWK